jgi:TPR repeat protein
MTTNNVSQTNLFSAYSTSVSTPEVQTPPATPTVVRAAETLLDFHSTILMRNIQARTSTKTSPQTSQKGHVFAIEKPTQGESPSEHLTFFNPSATEAPFITPALEALRRTVSVYGSCSFSPIKPNVLLEPSVQSLPLAATPTNDMHSSFHVAPQPNTDFRFEVPEARTPTHLRRPLKRIKCVPTSDTSNPQLCAQSSSILPSLMTSTSSTIQSQQPSSLDSSMEPYNTISEMPNLGADTDFAGIPCLQQIGKQGPKRKSPLYQEARNYLFGLGVEKDLKKAFQNFKLSAFLDGDRSAFYYVGFCYEHGICVERDADLAQSHYECALHMHDKESIGIKEMDSVLEELKRYVIPANVHSNSLPQSLSTTSSTTLGSQPALESIFFKASKDMDEPLKPCPQVRKRGRPIKKRGLQSIETPEREMISLKYFSKAIEYLYGFGVEKNPIKVLENFQLSLNQDRDPVAAYYIGYCYEFGIFLKKDPQLAQCYYDFAGDVIVDGGVLAALHLMRK